MKKLFFMAAAMLLIAGTVSAQYYRPRQHARPRQSTYNGNFRPTFELIGGINIANIVKSNGGNFNTNSKIGANVGVGFDLPVIYPLSITVEGLYSQKGYTQNTPYGEFKQRTDFIDVPILAKLHVAPNFNVLVGPQVSFLLSTTNTFDNGFTQSTQQVYNNTSNGYNKAIVGGVAGVSFDLGRNVELRGRYNIDLSKINEQGDQYVPAYRNQVFQIGLGIKF
ncbi:PorT family protein [Mucilaginibacter sp. RS28]|uniref:PorT family protein n=1 Tax=Mucilaginibacter straminoryzae TaxID=2932774 RepID=A0A9X2B7K3_9SPHI|nr:porin family protein [Mucilaginibacter straminoryzae]MCJ8208426.1 PorT family protein [Mucilaginibacter straminoryzae]